MASILRSTFCGFVALALAAAPLAASAAKLSQVRVGTHEDHTRIVLELDAATSYRLSPPGEGGSQLQIQLDADSVARHVASKSPLVKSVRVEPSQRGSTISIDLAKSGIEVSEMVLADPPRIVLDLKPAGSMAAMAAVPVPVPAPKPEPVPAAKPEPTPAPAPKVAAVPAAPPAEGRLAADGRPVGETAVKPVAPAGPTPSLADPVPSDIAKPAARFDAPVAKPEPTPPAVAPTAAPKPSAKADKPASAKPEIVAKATNPEIVAKPASPETAAGSANPEIVAKATNPEIAKAAEAKPASPIDAKPAAEPTPATKPAEIVVRKAAPPAEAKKPATTEAASWSDWLTSPTGYAAIGGVLLAAVVLAVRRRRRDEDDDPLYSVMSADDAGADDEDMRGQDHEDPIVEWGGNPDAAEQPTYAEATTNFDADEPISRDGSQQLALGRLQVPALEEPALPTVADADPDSLFDGPGAPLVATPQPTSISVPSDSSYGGDASRIAGELESRVKDMERRIEQLAEARERLERQVAAQTEELRVQRAAIARTQRVVRTMTKGEDLATEPVPRPPQA